MQSTGLESWTIDAECQSANHQSERAFRRHVGSVAKSQGLPIFWGSRLWDLFWRRQCPPCHHPIAVSSTAHGTFLHSKFLRGYEGGT
jgi:hypothetical protein